MMTLARARSPACSEDMAGCDGGGGMDARDDDDDNSSNVHDDGDSDGDVVIWNGNDIITVMHAGEAHQTQRARIYSSMRALVWDCVCVYVDAVHTLRHSRLLGKDKAHARRRRLMVLVLLVLLLLLVLVLLLMVLM